MNRAEAFKAVWTNPIGIRAMLWAKLPLAAFAGLRLRKLDDTGAQVSLPAGWKTQNPFRSTYFAAQAMAAEMSTGASFCPPCSFQATRRYLPGGRFETEKLPFASAKAKYGVAITWMTADMFGWTLQ